MISGNSLCLLILGKLALKEHLPDMSQVKAFVIPHNQAAFLHIGMP